MIEPADRLEYHAINHSGATEPADCGYFGLDADIVRALGKKGHLGYFPDNDAWEAETVDCGYYAMNRCITRALKRLARSG
jgi:hypothetical protein